jgi:carbon starvation protein
VFPFCFITIACGAISGFHTLIASGTTPKILTRESYARPIGYGAMCLESLVAIMALIAACTLDPGVYLGMNVKGDPQAVVQKINDAGYHVTAVQMNSLAQEMGEKTLFNRTAGAATLAVGMAQIFATFTQQRWLDLWYHFAIMFEALFILTTLDAGTRVGRYLLQDVLGSIWRPLADTRQVSANVLASLLMVAGWGYFLIQGVRDPLGGINSLWPLFGIANQMLAAIALCLGTTVLLKMQLDKGTPTAENPTAENRGPKQTRNPKSVMRGVPALALVTLVPLVWLLAVTMTAGVQKIFHSDPRIGFLAQAKVLEAKVPGLEAAVAAARAGGVLPQIEVAEKALHTSRVLHFNNILDAVIAGVFLLLVTGVVLLSAREWTLLLWGRKSARSRETEPVWLPDHALADGRSMSPGGVVAVGFALLKELSGEAHVDREKAAAICGCGTEGGREKKRDVRIYLAATERRFTGVRRCC